MIRGVSYDSRVGEDVAHAELWMPECGWMNFEKQVNPIIFFFLFLFQDIYILLLLITTVEHTKSEF